MGSGFLAQSIASFFNGSSQVVWLGSVINILTITLTPPISEAADLWGRKWFLVGGTVFAFVGCLIVSRAQSMGTVVAGFTVLSVCYGVQSLLLAVVSEVLPRKHRPIAQAAANVAAGFGAILGLCLGGALIKNGNFENFRIYFYVNAAIYAVAMLICVFLYNPPPRELQWSLTRSEKLRRLDWTGYAILPPGLTLWCIGLSWAGNPYSWKNVRVLVPLLLGLALALGFILYEVLFKKDGMLHHALFRNRNFSLALAAICAEGFIFFSCNNYFPFEVGVFQHSNTLDVGLHWVVSFGVSIVVAIAMSIYAARLKILRVPLVLGFLHFLVFIILMITTNHRTSGSALWGYPAILGAGFGMVLPNILSASQLSTPPEHIALATGLMVASRGVGGVIAVPVDNAIFQGAMSKLGSRIAAATIPLGLPTSSLGSLIEALVAGDTEALKSIEGATQEILVAGQSALFGVYELGFRNVWICAACVTAVTLLSKFAEVAGLLWLLLKPNADHCAVSAFFTDPSAEFTSHIDAPAEVLIHDTKVATVRGKIEKAESGHDEKSTMHQEIVTV